MFTFFNVRDDDGKLKKALKLIAVELGLPLADVVYKMLTDGLERYHASKKAQ